MKTKKILESKYVLSWGIHKGTIMSRDLGDKYYFDTEDGLETKWKELKDWFTGSTMNCKIWFASFQRPNSQKWEVLDSGEPYKR